MNSSKYIISGQQIEFETPGL